MNCSYDYCARKKLILERPTIGGYLLFYRSHMGLTQSALSEILGISRQYLCDVEKGRRGVSLSKAIFFSESLNVNEAFIVRLILQSLVDQAGLDYIVNIKPMVNHEI